MSGCVPGRGGVPDSVVGHLLCGDWATGAPAALGHHWWPPLAAVSVVICFIVVGWRMLRRRVWDTHASQGRWLQIIPPVTATPPATVGLWRLLATLLPAPRWWHLRPPRLVWEVQADPKGMRCGLWVPPGVNPTAVLRLLQRAWPGARAHLGRPPMVNGDRPAAGLALDFRRPQWEPLLDDDRVWRAGKTRGHDDTATEEDRLRAVYDGLAAAGRTGGALLQVHVCRAPRRRIAALRVAATHPERARRNGRAMPVTGLAALRWLTLTTLGVVTASPSRAGVSSRDPYATELARQARAKFADAPHLLMAVRTTTTGPTAAAAQAAAADVTSGYGLLCTHGRRRRVRHPVRAAWTRWMPTSRMVLANVIEVAAFAGLPSEPSTYGLPSAASRRRPASRDVFTTTGHSLTALPDTAPASTAPVIRRRTTAADPAAIGPSATHPTRPKPRAIGPGDSTPTLAPEPGGPREQPFHSE